MFIIDLCIQDLICAMDITPRYKVRYSTVDLGQCRPVGKLHRILEQRYFARVYDSIVVHLQHPAKQVHAYRLLLNKRMGSCARPQYFAKQTRHPRKADQLKETMAHLLLCRE